MYFSTVFLNCISQLCLSIVFLTQQDAFAKQCNCMQGEESIALGVNLQGAVSSLNVTPSAINSVEEQKQPPVLLLAQTIV